MAIQAAYNQAGWRRPRRKGSLRGYIEITHAPKQREEPDHERHQAERLHEERAGRGQQPSRRNYTGDDAGACEKC